MFGFLADFFRSDNFLSFLIWAFGIYHNQILKLFPQLWGRRSTKILPRKKNFKTQHHIHQKGWTKTTVNGNTIPLSSPTVHPTGVFTQQLWKYTVLTKRKILFIFRFHSIWLKAPLIMYTTLHLFYHFYICCKAKDCSSFTVQSEIISFTCRRGGTHREILTRLEAPELLYFLRLLPIGSKATAATAELSPRDTSHCNEFLSMPSKLR